MIVGLDSAYAPSNLSIQQAHGNGVKLWAGYFAGPNILNGWSQSDFARVKGAGLNTIAFCSGWSDAAAVRALSLNLGIPICLDVESNIRPDGAWVQPWLDASGAGLYGNAPVFNGRRAAFYILAAYPGYNPNATWPTNVPKPNGRCGWQWQGTHTAYGASVDSSWFDDSFVNLFGGGSVQLPTIDDVYALLNAVNTVTLKRIEDELTAVNAITLLRMEGEVKALQAAVAALPSADHTQPILDSIAALKLDLDNLKLGGSWSFDRTIQLTKGS